MPHSACSLQVLNLPAQRCPLLSVLSHSQKGTDLEELSAAIRCSCCVSVPLCVCTMWVRAAGQQGRTNLALFPTKSRDNKRLHVRLVRSMLPKTSQEQRTPGTVCSSSFHVLTLCPSLSLHNRSTRSERSQWFHS